MWWVVQVHPTHSGELETERRRSRSLEVDINFLFLIIFSIIEISEEFLQRTDNKKSYHFSKVFTKPINP